MLPVALENVHWALSQVSMRRTFHISLLSVESESFDLLFFHTYAEMMLSEKFFWRLSRIDDVFFEVLLLHTIHLCSEIVTPKNTNRCKNKGMKRTDTYVCHRHILSSPYAPPSPLAVL